jgi:hypothetical protein
MSPGVPTPLRRLGDPWRSGTLPARVHGPERRIGLRGTHDAVRDRRWSLLEDAREALTDAFAADGVAQIVRGGVRAFRPVHRYLCTATDTEWDALGSATNVPRPDAVVSAVGEVEVAMPAARRVRAILQEHGFTAEQLSDLVTLAQSQETVNRGFRGRWFDAIR